MSNDYSTITKSFAEGSARDLLRERSVLDHGTRSERPFLQRFVIIDVVFDPAAIDKVKLEHWEHDLGVSNMEHASRAPRNSVIARRVQTNVAVVVEPAMVLYPFMPPNVSLPCQPGEHVWVMFEDPAGTRNDLGYWMWRVVGPSHVEDVNHSHPHRTQDPSFTIGTKDAFDGNVNPAYEFRNGSVGEIAGDRYTIAETASLPLAGEKGYEDLITKSDAAPLTRKEAIPRYRKRPGEVVLEGTNNSLISLGDDRNGPVATYTDDPSLGKVASLPTIDLNGEGAGSIDIVVGRGQTAETGGNVVKNSLDRNEIAKGSNELVQAEGDPDLSNDRSRIRLSQRTKVDLNLSLSGFNSGEMSIIDSNDGDGAIVLKTDKVRLIARSDIELLVTSFKKDTQGRMVTVEDQSKWAAIVIKSDGSIVIRPAADNVIKLGGDDADKAIVCTDLPAVVASGKVSAPPLITTMGGNFANGISGQGIFATKILIK